MSGTLPNPRILVTKLLASITPPNHPSSDSNPLKDAPPTTKHTLQTLHVLYPNEFLPALDLLDRHLLIRVTIRKDGLQPTTEEPSSPTLSLADEGERDKLADEGVSVYYVRSAQQARSNYTQSITTGSATSRHYDPLATHYEVRTQAWNCSCPAFAFSAFPAGEDEDIEFIQYVPPSIHDERIKTGSNDIWEFGGLRLGSDIPVCKHMLACVLVERCEIFKGFVEERTASLEEIAGWAAGWGG
jgi:hypothetical protein